MAKKARTFFVQYSQDYDIHDSAGNLRNPDPTYFKSTKDLLDGKKWLEWRKSWLQSLLLKKDEKKKAGQKARKGKAVGICHYADIKKDKSLKPTHLHAYVTLQATMDVEKAIDFFEVTRPLNCQAVKNKAQALKYMLHITNQAIADGKHIYSEDDLWSINFDNRQEMLDFFKKTISRKSKKSEKITVDDEALTNLCGFYIEQGKLTLTQAKRIFQNVYGSQNSTYYSKNEHTLKVSFESYLNQKAEEFRTLGRRLTTILISGDGGSGKSVLASAMAYNASNLHDWHAVATTGKNKTSDVADGYSGQDVAVFNEFDGNTESFRAFCSIFDPYNYTPISSRNKNKQMTITKAILTTSDNVLEFVEKCVFQGSADDKLLAQNIINNYKSLDEILNLNPVFDDSGAFDQVQNKNMMMNVARDHSFQVARRIACYITIKKNAYPYVPASAGLGLSLDTDLFLKHFTRFDFDDLEHFNFNDLIEKPVPCFFVNGASSADTAIQLNFFGNNARKYIEGPTFFVKDVKDKSVMQKVALAIDEILKIADTSQAENVEEKIINEAIEMSKK